MNKEDSGSSVKKRNRKNKIETIKNRKEEELWKLQKWQRDEIDRSKSFSIGSRNYCVRNMSWKEEGHNNWK